MAPEGNSVSATDRGASWTTPLRRLVAGHFIAASAEWCVYIAAFVYAFGQGGTAGTGLASVILLASTIGASPVAGLAIARLPANRARLLALALMAAGCLAAGAAIALELPLPLVLVGSVVALSSFTLLRPSQAVLIPTLADRPQQLSTTNLWIGHSDSAAALAGPGLSTILMVVGGPAVVFIGFGLLLVVAIGLQMIDHQRGAPASKPSGAAPPSPWKTFGSAFRQLRQRTGTLTLIALIGFQFAVVGALDLLFVVIALDTLGLDNAAPSLLTTFFGIGALGAVALSTYAHRSARLASSLSLGLAAAGIAVLAISIALSISTGSILPMLIGLPPLGAARFVVVVVSRALLQRSADNETIGAVFVLMELGSGVGILLGSIITQVMLALSGPILALQALGVGYLLLLVATRRSVKNAEETATVPLVEMDLLRRVPAFGPLPPMTLETVARESTLMEVEADTVVIEQGEAGDQFYAVMSGEFDVTMFGEHMRTAGKGDSFGEVALLANVNRTATITATAPGTLLAIGQEPFLRAITGHDPAAQAAWSTIKSMEFGEQQVNDPNGGSV